jgi:hypothetical protein
MATAMESLWTSRPVYCTILFMGVRFRYCVMNDPASNRVFNMLDRSASADNPRLQPGSNTRSFTLLNHRIAAAMVAWNILSV